MSNKTQLELEQAIHTALDEGDDDTVRAYAEFAAGEIDSMTVADLLEAICCMDHRNWQALLDRIGGTMKPALQAIATELERKRAAFMEHQAQLIIKQREAEQSAKAEMA